MLCVAVPKVVHEVVELVVAEDDSCEQGVDTQFYILVEATRSPSDST